jgi:hypothetical protein
VLVLAWRFRPPRKENISVPSGFLSFRTKLSAIVPRHLPVTSHPLYQDPAGSFRPVLLNEIQPSTSYSFLPSSNAMYVGVCFTVHGTAVWCFGSVAGSIRFFCWVNALDVTIIITKGTFNTDAFSGNVCFEFVCVICRKVRGVNAYRIYLNRWSANLTVFNCAKQQVGW